jgi:hypothetical protein
MQDDFQVAKNNEKLQKTVEETIKDSGFTEVDDVVVNAKFDW